MMKLKSAYTQVTLNRVTVAFFLVSVVHCFAQGITQSFLFSIDSQYAGLLTDIVHAAEIPLRNMTFLEGSSHRYTLRMCDNFPHGQSPYPCTVVFQSGVDDVHNSSGTEAASHSDLTDSSVPDSAGNISGVNFRSSAGVPTLLSKQCTQILVYPQQILQKAVVEDITFILFQFWLLSVSLFAMARTSIPHLLTALGSRFLITSWSSYTIIFKSYNQQTIFQQLVSAPGTPCGVDLFPTFFGTRVVYNIVDVILSWSALLLTGLLSWNLLKRYNAETFRHVGPPKSVFRIYKFFMAVEACLQLEVFVIVAATSLWVDVLVNTSISEISEHTKLYDALIVTTTVLVLPWIALGWYGVRREDKSMMIPFLVITFVFVSGWSVMFYSTSYRWTFVQWPFLGCFTVASLILMLASVILGTACWWNFGQGLAEYLNADDALASSNFAGREVFKLSEDEKDVGDIVSPIHLNFLHV